MGKTRKLGLAGLGLVGLLGSGCGAMLSTAGAIRNVPAAVVAGQAITQYELQDMENEGRKDAARIKTGKNSIPDYEIRGDVKGVDLETGIVLITPGLDKDVKEGYIFYAKNDEGVVARLQVVKTYPEFSGARILLIDNQKTIEKGYGVVSYKNSN